MRFLIIFTFLLLKSPIISVAQYTAKIGTSASVVFPSKPQEMQEQGQQIIFNTLDIGHKVTGMATVIDAGTYGVDSAMVASNYHNTLFIDLIMQGIIGQYKGMQLISKRKIAKGKLMGYDMELNNDVPTEEVPYKKIFAQILFSGAKIYALTVLAEDKIDATKDKDKFFASLKVE